MGSEDGREVSDALVGRRLRGAKSGSAAGGAHARGLILRSLAAGLALAAMMLALMDYEGWVLALAVGSIILQISLFQIGAHNSGRKSRSDLVDDVTVLVAVAATITATWPPLWF